MSTKAVHENGAERATLSQKLNDFIMKFRLVFIAVLIAFVVFFAGILTYTTITEKRATGAYEKTEKLVKDWEIAKGASDLSGLSAKEDEIIQGLLAVAKSNKSSFAGARANMSIAEIYFSRKDWKNAEDYYLAAAKADTKAYTQGICLYNAAVCSDEQGNEDAAIELFNKTISLEDFALKSRAYFNIGRIEEQRSHAEAAITAYQKLAEQFPDDEWTKLAKSRIIALQIK